MALLTHLNRKFERSAGTALVIDAKVKGEANSRFTADANGKLRWGPGGGTALDTTLERVSAAKLKTPDSFEVAGTLTIAALGGVLKASSGAVSGSATTSDLPEGSNLYWTQGRFDAALAAVKGAANGVATLGADTKIPTSQLPALAITDTFVVASQAAMLALSAQTGDVAVRTDLNKSFILRGADPAVLGDWQEMLTPTDAVLSVNGQTGAVVLTTTHISEGTNLYHTTARARDAVATVGTGVIRSDGGSLSALAGTSNRLAKWGSSTLVDSILVDDGSHITPTGNGTQNLGGVSNRFAIVRATAFADGADQLLGSSGTAVLHGNSSTWTEQRFYTDGVLRWKMPTGGRWEPNADNTYDIGTASARVKEVHSYSFRTPVGTVQQQLNTRLLAGALHFDGVTAGAKVTSTLTNQNIATGDFSVWVRARIPTSDPAAGHGLFGLSSSSSTSAANGFGAFINSDGSLKVILYGTTTSDWRRAVWSGFRSAHSGRVVDLVVTRSGTTLTLYIDGVATAAGSEETSGTPPAWSGSITSTYAHVGIESSTLLYADLVLRFAAFNLALSTAEIAETIAGGVPYIYRWGTQSEIVTNGTFGADTDWTKDSGWTIGSGVLSAASAANNSQAYQTSATTLVVGKRYRAKFSVSGYSAGAVRYAIGDGTANEGSPRSANGSYTEEFTLLTAGNQQRIAIRASGTTSASVDDFSVVRIGSFIDLDLQHANPAVNTTVRDRSSNNLDGTATATGIEQTLPVKEFICDRAIVSTLTASQLVQTDANKRLVSSNALPAATTIGGFNLARGRVITIDSASVSGGLISGLTDPLTVTHGLASQNLLWQLRYAADRAPVDSSLTATNTTTASLAIGVTPGDGEFELVLAAF